MLTYLAARSMMLAGLAGDLYTVKASLKVPQAVSVSGSHTLRFKAQAVYLECPALGINHSMHLDIRALTYEQFRAVLARWLQPSEP